MKKVKLTVLPEAMKGTVMDITLNKHAYQFHVSVHWRIKAGYVLARLGLWLIETGSKLAGITVNTHSEGEQ